MALSHSFWNLLFFNIHSNNTITLRSSFTIRRGPSSWIQIASSLSKGSLHGMQRRDSNSGLPYRGYSYSKPTHYQLNCAASYFISFSKKNFIMFTKILSLWHIPLTKIEKPYNFLAVPENYFSAEFRSVLFRASEWALPWDSEFRRNEHFFRGITESVPRLFRGIFSERNSVANPNMDQTHLLRMKYGGRRYGPWTS